MLISSRIKNRLNSFSLALDIAFKNSTEDQIRNNLATSIKNELFQIPHGHELILYITKEIMTKGLTETVINNIKSIKNIKTDFENNLAKVGLENLNDLKDYTIFQSIRNYTIDLQEKIISFTSDIDIPSAVKEIVTIDITKAFNRDRNKIQAVLKIGEIYLKGLNLINQTDEIYYGSASAESTYTLTEDLLKSVPNSFDKTITTLEQISKGEYQEVVSTSSYDISS